MDHESQGETKELPEPLLLGDRGQFAVVAASSFYFLPMRAAAELSLLQNFKKKRMRAKSRSGGEIGNARPHHESQTRRNDDRSQPSASLRRVLVRAWAAAAAAAACSSTPAARYADAQASAAAAARPKAQGTKSCRCLPLTHRRSDASTFLGHHQRSMTPHAPTQLL